MVAAPSQWLVTARLLGASPHPPLGPGTMIPHLYKCEIM